MKKKNLSLLLAGAMTLGMATSALAAEKTTTITEVGDETLTKESQVTLDGTIEKGTVLLSVVMPTSIDFTVATNDATADVVPEKGIANANSIPQAQGHVFFALLSGEGTVTNNSNVPIKLELVNVADASGLLKKMDLAIKSNDLDVATALSTPLEAKSYVGSEITLANSIAAKGGTTNLAVVGQGAKGQYSGLPVDVDLPSGEYTVSTTMKISVVSE